jgi:putative transposase
MIEAIRQGLKEDGFEVSISKLCRWFGVPSPAVRAWPL